MVRWAYYKDISHNKINKLYMVIKPSAFQEKHYFVSTESEARKMVAETNQNIFTYYGRKGMAMR